MHVSIPPELRRFALDQAEHFFGNNASRYVARLIELDRVRGTVREDIERRLASIEDREAVTA